MHDRAQALIVAVAFGYTLMIPVSRREPFNSTPNGGQFDFAWPSARTPHGGASYVWRAYRNQEKYPPENTTPRCAEQVSRACRMALWQEVRNTVASHVQPVPPVPRGVACHLATRAACVSVVPVVPVAQALLTPVTPVLPTPPWRSRLALTLPHTRERGVCRLPPAHPRSRSLATVFPAATVALIAPLATSFPAVTAAPCTLLPTNQATPIELHGRVFALQKGLSKASLPAAALLAGPLGDLAEAGMREGGWLAPTVGAWVGVG